MTGTASRKKSQKHGFSFLRIKNMLYNERKVIRDDESNDGNDGKLCEVWNDCMGNMVHRNDVVYSMDYSTEPDNLYGAKG